MKTAITFLALLLLFATACDQSGPAKTENAPPKVEAAKPAVNRAEEEKAIREADIAWAAVAAKKDVDATAAFMTDDCATLAPKWSRYFLFVPTIRNDL